MEQAQCITPADVLIAISFYPYAKDTLEIITMARDRNVACIAISDSDLSPVGSAAQTHFSIHDAEVKQFRSLTATMIVAQVLATGVAFENSKNAS